jgi:hypothetical protein
MFRSILLFILLFPVLIFAGQLAITDTGDEVILNDDGTWVYKNRAPVDKQIAKNNEIFLKSDSANFKLKSRKNNSVFYIDTNKWIFKKSAGEMDAGEYEFQLKGKDVYGQAITEEISIPLESLPMVALENASGVAPDARIIKQEYRNVNGLNVIYIQLAGTIQGIQFMYLGYYYSDESGTTQFVTWTSPALVKKYKKDIFSLLNGYAVR